MSRDLVKGVRLQTKKSLDVQELANAIERGFMKKRRPDEEWTQKKTFAPSTIAYGHGTCFAGETEFVTQQYGIKTLAEMSGEEVMVWTGPNSRYQAGGWKPATVESFGVHPLSKITLEKRGMEKVLFATREHRWIAAHIDQNNKSNRDKQMIVTTEDLAIGQQLWSSGGAINSSVDISPDGVRAGFVFGDGDVDRSNLRSGARVRLFGDKDLVLTPYFMDYKISDIEILEGYSVPSRRVSGLPRAYKEAPRYDESASYLYGWLAGYFAADGNVSDAVTLSSASMDNINIVRDVSAMLNIKTGAVTTRIRMGINGEMLPIHTITFKLRSINDKMFLHDHHRSAYLALLEKSSRRDTNWRVKSVEHDVRVEEVFCVVEPETERFTLADDLITKNCPRYWYLVFDGLETFSDSVDALGLANMSYGTKSHEDIQEALEAEGILVDSEVNIELDDPPIHGFIDAIVKIGDKEFVGEIKTTRNESFIFKQLSGKPSANHLIQLLIYMYATNHDDGFLLYVNKNDQTILILPVEMDENNKNILDDVFEWLRAVRKSWDDRSLPIIPFRKSRETGLPENKVCDACPVRQACFAAPEGDVKIPRMEVPKL